MLDLRRRRDLGALLDDAFHLLVIGALAGVIGGLLGLLLSAVLDNGVAFVTFSTPFQTVLVSFGALAGTLLFFDLRTDKEVAHP